MTTTQDILNLTAALKNLCDVAVAKPGQVKDINLKMARISNELDMLLTRKNEEVFANYKLN